MLPIQRKQAILDLITKNEINSIGKLSDQLNVSEMTIRRDLSKLEEEGLVQRTHGGAIMVSNIGQEPRYQEKKGVRHDIKEQLARYVVTHFVQNDQVIILEGGTTISCMANYLHKIDNLTVVTNGFNTLGKLNQYLPQKSILCCGGFMRDVSLTFVGHLAERFFQQINAQSAFFSASGLTLDQGFTDPNMMEVQVKQAMCRAAQKKYMLIDSSKFGKISLLTTFSFNEIDVVITDLGAPSEMVDLLREKGLEVHIAEEP